MVTCNRSPKRGICHRAVMTLAAAYVSAMLPALVAFGQDYIGTQGAQTPGPAVQNYQVLSPEVDSTMDLPWWQGMWYHADGTPRYRRGFASSTRHFQNRIPVFPPVCGPNYGYNQPCWRQLPVDRRCVTCETIPGMRVSPTPGPVPPALAPSSIPDIPPTPGDLSPSDVAPEKSKEEAIPDVPAPTSRSDSPKKNVYTAAMKRTRFD